MSYKQYFPNSFSNYYFNRFKNNTSFFCYHSHLFSTKLNQIEFVMNTSNIELLNENGSSFKYCIMGVKIVKFNVENLKYEENKLRFQLNIFVQMKQNTS